MAEQATDVVCGTCGVVHSPPGFKVCGRNDLIVRIADLGAELEGQRHDKEVAERAFDAEKARADAAERARNAVVQGEECRNLMRCQIAEVRGLIAECLALNPMVSGDMEKVRVWADVVKRMSAAARGEGEADEQPAL